jgi:hypothetical protein
MQERLAIISIGGNTLIRRGDSGDIQEVSERRGVCTRKHGAEDRGCNRVP